MADRYWVGGTASWDATAGTKWALTDGGLGGQAVPTALDDVYFTALSGTVTVTVAVASVARNLNFTGFTGTFAGSSQVSIYGNLVLASGWTRTYTGTFLFASTSTGNTISSGGITLGGLVQFNGAGGGWTVTTNLTTTGNFTTSQGSVTVNSGLTITANAFTTSGTNTRSWYSNKYDT